jgi:hypothetical protein
MEPQMITKRMPNTMFSCITQVRDALQSGKLQLPLTAESLRGIGMKSWNIHPTKRSLADLQWFHDGYPTPWFERFAQSHETDHQAYVSMLKTFLREGFYAEIFTRITEAHIDLYTASATQLERFFKGYDPQSEALNMAYLFLAFCREAGLAKPLDNRSHLSNGKTASKDQQTVKVDTASEAQEGTSMNGVPHDTKKESAGLPSDQEFSLIKAQSDHLQLLLQQLSRDAEQLKQKPAKWVESLKGNFNVLMQLLEEREEEK